MGFPSAIVQPNRQASVWWWNWPCVGKSDGRLKTVAVFSLIDRVNRAARVQCISWFTFHYCVGQHDLTIGRYVCRGAMDFDRWQFKLKRTAVCGGSWSLRGPTTLNNYVTIARQSTQRLLNYSISKQSTKCNGKWLLIRGNSWVRSVNSHNHCKLESSWDVASWRWMETADDCWNALAAERWAGSQIRNYTVM